MLVLIIIYLIGLAAWYGYRKLQARREARRRRDAEAGFRRRIQNDPSNTAAYEGLGDLYREAQRLIEALGAYQKALQTAGDRPGAGIQYKIRQIQMDLDASARRSAAPPQGRRLGKARDLHTCVFCGASNPLNARTCEECGGELLHDTYLESLKTIWTNEGQRKKMLEFAAVVTIPLLCIAFASNLSLEVKGVLIISTAIVGGWVFLNSFSGNIH
ncbi:MAG: hypothetical protein ABIY70_06170 [Capsulimonas sp.]|uniref:hypothetical protein n=1 Tax=Capsulimonas sp. TaxID=2494211 RepID=UPI0032678418